MRAAPQAVRVGPVPPEQGAEGLQGSLSHLLCPCSEVNQSLPCWLQEWYPGSSRSVQGWEPSGSATRLSGTTRTLGQGGLGDVQESLNEVGARKGLMGCGPLTECLHPEAPGPAP